MRLKNIHIVNQPYVFNMVYQVLKPFVSSKLKKRIIMHGEDLESLYKYIPKEDLCTRYGGPIDLGENTGKRAYEYMLQFEAEFESNY